MNTIFKRLRAQFLTQTAERVAPLDLEIILLTHILPDRPEFLSAIRRIAPIKSVIAVPYSTHHETLSKLRTEFEVITPDLATLRRSDYLIGLVRAARGTAPTAIMEIGGYFAPVLQDLRTEFAQDFLGVVEDTEIGHRRYQEAQPLPCPVVSVARSTLKAAEDSLVGPSCVYSIERLIREAGFPLAPCTSLVLGYGRVGRGVAAASRSRGWRTVVYDVDPTRRLLALSEGFAVPQRSSALANAHLILGATGSRAISRHDYRCIKRGAILASCSSQDIEFDVAYLKTSCRVEPVVDGIRAYHRGDSVLYLLGEGRPVNFLHGAVIGPILTLVQAEILLALRQLWNVRALPGMHEVPPGEQLQLVSEWMTTFCDQDSGSYRLCEKQDE
jgi:adenosylhomocysteinase